MDPDVALAELLEKTRMVTAVLLDGEPDKDWHTVDQVQDDIVAVCERIQELDTWLRAGGFLPRTWVHHRENEFRANAVSP